MNNITNINKNVFHCHHYLTELQLVWFIAWGQKQLASEMWLCSVLVKMEEVLGNVSDTLYAQECFLKKNISFLQNTKMAALLIDWILLNCQLQFQRCLTLFKSYYRFSYRSICPWHSVMKEENRHDKGNKTSWKIIVENVYRVVHW